jgi:serine/threonine protein kinase
VSGQTEHYFKKVNGEGLSLEFKDLILALFSYDGDKRPTIDQLRAHPWLNKSSFNMEATRQKLLHDIALKQGGTASQPQLNADKPMTKPVKVRRSTVHH